MHRTSGGWHLVGQVALDDADVTGSLARLRGAAESLEPGGIATKLLIPNDQIKYLALDTTRAEDEQVRDALHGATPYAVDELTYDFAKGGGRTYVAAVARETLDEAQQFATEHGFNPISFAAVPEPFTYVGEAFFGATNGHTAERDAEPVVVIGEADVTLPDPAPIAEPEPEPEPVVADAVQTATPVEPESQPQVEAEPTPEPDANPEPEFIPDPIPAPVAEPDPEAAQTAAEVEPQEPPAPDIDDTPTEPVHDDAPPQDADDAATIEEDTPAPMFASRLRADRNEGRPAEKPETPDAPTRAEPTFSRAAPPALAVPTDAGETSVPPLAAPSRDADNVATAPITTDAPDADVAVPVTGEASTALSPDAAVSAASLTVEPDAPDAKNADDKDASEPRSGAAATAMGAASAVGGAVGGMFASRRMARAEAKAKEAAKPAEPARKTVFGARKQPKPKPVIGGKPRFLGLILTAILLLFLLAIAAFAALSEEGIASWFGFGSADTQIAATDPATVPEVAAAVPAEPQVASAPDALATPTAPPGGQVLSPEEATRIYAATGVWQRAPRIPQTPRTTSLDTLALGTPASTVPRVPSSPLSSVSSISGDALIATPIDPPAPDTTFNFGSDGLVVATEQGNVTPDGILVIAGAPPLNPPTRPGTVAPEITPQDQLAALTPEEAAPVVDAPEGVIVIAGRPAIEPPIRTGTQAPAPEPQAAALAAGDAPLLATDGLLVLAGSPPVLPPIRPGTAAPVATPIAVIETPTVPAPAPEDIVEGLNVIAGAPPVLPPARPGTIAPQNDAALDSLTADVAAALAVESAVAPTADTRRPLARPATVIRAAAAVANTPVLGALTVSQASAFRPRTRPAGLAPVPAPTPDPEPALLEAAAPAATQNGLQISPAIAAAVQAAASRPNPIVNPTALAVPTSSRPDPRPRNMDRIVARANQAQERAAAQVASVAPRTVAPSGPTGGAVAQNATLENAMNLRDVNLIGIYGGSSDRRALVRLGNGRYVRVTVGDRLDGGRVTAISAGALSYTKRGRAVTLQVAG
ncbi:hypothetical protein L0664_03690 [Octadecabacter sp. G9-8]|uniref:Type IV pilus biogenesis n=1 Tax=Octadecabacter dasysiphoniae TaxID=2909341 RepID=A0ABS9CSF6_9RHOB|nr:hypothetical protein [Octadecabacter dasysiphoniae]MCF2870160.1 hypothetical protein [Octadecabacter dasysiphoniae]